MVSDAFPTYNPIMGNGKQKLIVCNCFISVTVDLLPEISHDDLPRFMHEAAIGIYLVGMNLPN